MTPKIAYVCGGVGVWGEGYVTYVSEEFLLSITEQHDWLKLYYICNDTTNTPK